MTEHNVSQSGAPTFGRGLYYPYFRVQDVNWLKAALLYWDEISCIVPQGYDPGNPEELRPAEEFILTVDPEPYTEQAEATFRQHVLPLVELRDQPKAQAMLAAVAKTIGNKHVWVHANKMTGNLRQELEQRGILRQNQDERMFLADGFDALYMICLAKEMSLTTGRPPLTDTEEFAECEALMQFDARPPAYCSEGNSASMSLLMQLGIDLPTSDQLSHIPLATVLSHHRKRQGERRVFRQAVEGIIATASEMADATALADYLTDQRRDIENQINDYRKCLNELNVQAAVSVLDISVPAWGTGVVGAGVLAGTPVGAALAGLGLSIKAVEWWVKVRPERRQAISSCPWHYWMDTQRRFGRS